MNCLFRMPIRKKKEFEDKKIKIGAMGVVCKGEICVSGWKDNKPDYLASNKLSASTQDSVSRERMQYDTKLQYLMIS